MNDPVRPRLGLMGGTFDPIHFGHLAAASEAADRLKLDRVIFMPAGSPWQKENRPVTDAEHRYAMTLLATAADPRFVVSRLEIDRSGPTYSIDTIRRLQLDSWPASPEWFLIAGIDALNGIADWREASALVESVRLVAVSRPGHELSTGEPLLRGCVVVAAPGLAISSSDCRDRVRSGRPIRYLVPSGVAAYVEKHDLYTGGHS